MSAYFLLLEASAAGKIPYGNCFNIGGEEAFQLTEVVDLMLGMSHRKDIKDATDADRLRPIDANYQMFDSFKIRTAIAWKPQILARKIFSDLLAYWRQEISKGKIPLNR